MSIKILHLYYDIMNLYGEYANVKILEKHLTDQGISVKVDYKTINEKINISSYDFIYIGEGTEKNQLFVLDDLIKYKDDLKKYIEDGKFILLTGNAYELLGKRIGKKDALNIFDFEVEPVKERIATDVIANCSFLNNKIIGFVNFMANITSNDRPLFEIIRGKGDNKHLTQEGIKYKNLYGTHLIGPILLKNPELLKYIISELIHSKNKDFEIKNIYYYNEEEGYKIALKELEENFPLEY